MSRVERIAIGIVLAATCPLLSFVLFWWTSAVGAMDGGILPVSMVPPAAFTGLAIGVILDVLFLKRWVAAFYSANLALMTGLYLALCAVATAFFMGLPFGTFGLGVLAGAYVGRREHLLRAEGERPQSVRLLSRAALLAASVTTGLAVPFGLMGLHESVTARIANALGLSASSLLSPFGYTCVAAMCVALFPVQFFFAKLAGKAALGSPRLPGRREMARTSEPLC